MMISNVQALRAFASAAVMLYHMNYRWAKDLHTDFQGVSIFFVISGFIMTYITLRDKKEVKPKSFILQRIIRIVPLYWFSVFLLIALSNLGLLNLQATLPRIGSQLLTAPLDLIEWFASMFNLFNSASPSDLLRTLLFIPYKDINGDIHPLLGVGWTLNIEMYFYVIFSLALFLGKCLAPIFSSVIIIAVWLIGKHAAYSGNDWLRLYSNDYSLYFVGGIAVYYLWTGLNKIAAAKSRRRWILGAIATISALAYILSNLFYLQASSRFPLILASGPSLLVLAALLAHTIGYQVQNKFILLLGAASYSLYLEHTIVLEILRTITNKSGSFLNFSTTVSGVAIAAAFCIIAAIAVHLKIEMPSQNWLKKKLRYKLNRV